MENIGQGQRTPIKNIDIFEKWATIDEKQKNQKITEYVMELLNISDCEESIFQALEKCCEYICLKIQSKWKACSRNKHLFQKRHAVWLDSEMQLPESVQHIIKSQDDLNQPGPSRGRPQKTFSEASLKTKKRRVDDLVTTRTPEELRFAADVSQSPRKKPSGSQESRLLSPQQAVALCLDLDLSERKYQILRSVVNAMHPECFPSLYVLRNTKKELLPANITVTEQYAEVEFQEVLNKTAGGILKTLNINEKRGVTLTCKWGFDGSSGHSTYKQKFSEKENTDEFMFLVAFCPLQLVDDASGEKLWVNPRPSSTLFCRPVKFIFIKENAEVVRREEREMNSKINKLIKFTVSTENIDVEVSYKMLFTMVDGSICNILSDTNATAKCYICNATPKEMNTKKISDKTPTQENYRFGLSTLHCWIRCFECILHISYRLPFKTWQVRGEENKATFENRKKEVQLKFKSEMGLIVDKPKPGYGTSNDGNTARRFFSNPSISARITGVDESLIQSFSLILRILASGRKINVQEFDELLRKTRDLYLNLYSWYYMPSSVHKLLIHGSAIISAFDLPIGQLSEEALEARHKETRKHRLSHTRKSSREYTNRDLMTILLLTSDPLLSGLRKTMSKKSTIIDSEMKKYILKEPVPPSDNFPENLISEFSADDTASEPDSD